MTELWALIGVSLAVGTFIYLPFKWLDAKANEELRVNVGLWILGEGPEMNWREQARGLLDRVFGEKHFSIRCAGSSVFISVAIFSSFLAVYRIFFTEETIVFKFVVSPEHLIDASCYLISVSVNYASLLQTRWLLKISEATWQPFVLAMIVAIDAALNVLLVVMTLLVAVLVYIAFANSDARESLFSASVYGSLQIVLDTLQFVISIVQEEPPLISLLLIFVVANSTTSVWLWLYALSLGAVKFVRGNLLLNRIFSRWLDDEQINKHSIALVGNVAATIAFLAVLGAGGAMMALGE